MPSKDHKLLMKGLRSKLLYQQIQLMKKEGKNKEHIMEHFQLTEEEWNQIN